MQIKFNNIKTNIINSGISPKQESTQKDQIEDYFTNAFDGGTSTATGTSQQSNSNPVDDYTFGDVKAGTMTTDNYSSGISNLESFPPSLEEVLAGNSNAKDHLDIIKQKYESAKTDLLKLKTVYESTLTAGTTTADEASKLTYRLSLVQSALTKCDKELANLKTLENKFDAQYKLELSSMKDLNNDGWIGKPRATGSLYVKVTSDGKYEYYDATTKCKIPNPETFSKDGTKLTEDKSLKMITKDQALNADKDENKADLYLRLTEEALKANKGFQTPINALIPQYLWMKKKTSSSSTGISSTGSSSTGSSSTSASIQNYLATDDKDAYEKGVVYNQWSSENGIQQKIPTNKDEYIQVQVHAVKVYSTASGLTDKQGNKLYNTVIELYNGDKDGGIVLARIRIEGFYDTANKYTNLQALTSDAKGYIAASSVGLGFDGKGAIVQFDASQYKSTARHIVDNMAGALGIGSGPQSTTTNTTDKTRGQSAYAANFQPFQDVDKNFAYDTGLHDTYVAESFTPTSNTTSQLSYRTGIFLQNMRGDITGTRYNDVTKTIGIDEYYKLKKDNLPDNSEKIKYGDGLWSNRVTGGGGNNIVVVGDGDNYVFDATFVWGKGNSKTNNYIAMKELTSAPLGGTNTYLSSSKINPSTFVHLDGGTSHIVNPDETDPSYKPKNSLTSDSPDTVKAAEEEIKKQKESYRNDYYEVSGNSYFSKPDDEDIANNAGKGGEQQEGLSLEKMRTAATEPMNDFLDELIKEGDYRDASSSINWNDVIGAKTELDSEMNGFFNEMFNDIDSLFGGSSTSGGSSTLGGSSTK